MLSLLRPHRLITALIAAIAAMNVTSAFGDQSDTTHAPYLSDTVNRVASDNARALDEWLASHSSLVASLSAAVESDDPLPALQRLEASGNFMATYMASECTTRSGLGHCQLSTTSASCASPRLERP